MYSLYQYFVGNARPSNLKHKHKHKHKHSLEAVFMGHFMVCKEQPPLGGLWSGQSAHGCVNLRQSVIGNSGVLGVGVHVVLAVG